MKTTIELPEELFRRAKTEAASTGRKLSELVEEALRRVLDAPRKTRGRTLAALTKRGRGSINSGVSDLGSNPKHLEGLGSNGQRRY